MTDQEVIEKLHKETYSLTEHGREYPDQVALMEEAMESLKRHQDKLAAAREHATNMEEKYFHWHEQAAAWRGIAERLGDAVSQCLPDRQRETDPDENPRTACCEISHGDVRRMDEALSELAKLKGEQL